MSKTSRTASELLIILAACCVGLLLPCLGGLWARGEQAASPAAAPTSQPAPQPAVTMQQLEQDWVAQDCLWQPFSPAAIAKPLAELGKAGADLARQFEQLRQANTPPADEQWRTLYRQACSLRRAKRLAPRAEALRHILFVKRPYELGGSHYAYTEGQSDAQSERHFVPNAALCSLETPDPAAIGVVRTLLADKQGTLRDPDVSFDGKRILFSWKKSDLQDDFHLYEMTLADSRIRQLTDGLGFADYECAYLPNGDIVFNSSRCVQTVDCWYTEVSNLYTCDGDGRYLRRVSYDQVHTNYPTVTPDGRVIYTRWDYNDRGQIWPQGLMQMNSDGTAQSEFYGNDSWFPTTLLHARAIPGTDKVVAIFSGHHTIQKGWLGIIDPAMGREENQGTQLIAPVRATEAVHVDGYGQSGDQFQYPYPLSETEFLVTLKPAVPQPPVAGAAAPPSNQSLFGRFGLYFITADGRRELLAYDNDFSCTQPIPISPRPQPYVRASQVDYTKSTGTIYIQDIYQGPGLAGVPRGTIKSLRVVGLRFRAAAVGDSGNGGPAGGAYVSSPISLNGAWDVKVVLGTTKVHDDGSACFEVPARTPIYFQPLDANGRAVQTMRSWATLQPGEHVSCVGCHESKNAAAPRPASMSLALRGGPQPLTSWYGPPRGFSFQREVQPILDRHCTSCHNLAQPPKGMGFHRERTVDLKSPSPWRYTLDAPPANWAAADFDDSAWKTGEGRFGLRDPRRNDNNNLWTGPRIWLRRAFELPADVPLSSLILVIDTPSKTDVCINGSPALSMSGSGGVTDPKILALLKPGKNILAIAAHDNAKDWSQYIDVKLQDGGYRRDTRPADPTAKLAFSLMGGQVWSDAYMALANPNFATWTSPQSAPTMAPPYDAGANKSKLIVMLEKGHNDVKLSVEELDRLSTWIDIAVPCYGDYTEGLVGGQLDRYNHFLDKRTRWEQQEERNIQDLIRSGR